MRAEPTLNEILFECQKTNRLIERRPTRSEVQVIVSDEVRQAMSEHRNSCVPRTHFQETAQLAAQTAGRVEAMEKSRPTKKGDGQLLRWARLILPLALAAAGSSAIADYLGWFK